MMPPMTLYRVGFSRSIRNDSNGTHKKPGASIIGTYYNCRYRKHSTLISEDSIIMEYAVIIRIFRNFSNMLLCFFLTAEAFINNCAQLEMKTPKSAMSQLYFSILAYHYSRQNNNPT